MVLTAKYRPNALDSLITLFSKLIENDGPDNCLRFLKNDVTKTIFRSMYVGKPFPGESSNFAFLFESMNNGIYTPDEITDKIRTFHFNNPKFYRTSAWLFAWFAPEIFHSDQKFYDQIKKHTIPTYKEIERYAKAIKKFIDKFDDYSENDFALLRTARLQSQHRTTLLSIIKRDNVEGLINYFSFPMNNIFSRLEPSLYCPNPFIQYKPSFNMVAAFYGSINAFKYFCGNDLSHDQLDNKLSNLAQFAVAGGCMEIIRMCEDIGCSFTMTAHIAALYHRIDILKWLHEKYNLDLNAFDSMGYIVLHRSAEGNCISAIK
ncbi:hypothetical protein TVAG_254320 [Trichomonas vaginalis G3]|uniref:DUF3447 domain-containing protein n=1 Tax=Trichomonas vaginalis (strain ATCC PRA-98 / G3) TaxID=412133 RepID=A2DMU9_TRIV3|nr:spectrin binding [Trichomonas vaginalis G3]EAY18320.1 hypothetical protein TVAG_254320 [Trichomonas vaginalis G3]KAI5541858.1 spectrin binding [Trichomonas vaginalis G3]|eukprot:XP_001579306.1 hypothetical protein [Trichomonas vaginalis G3]